jgi:hypothetical protein
VLLLQYVYSVESEAIVNSYSISSSIINSSVLKLKRLLNESVARGNFI